MVRFRKAGSIALVLILSLILFSCGSSKGPAVIKPGSPAFFWAAAQASYDKGEFIKTSEQLSQILQSDNEFRPRARVMAMVINAGLAEGDNAWAEALDSGAKLNPKFADDFRKRMRASRNNANIHAMQFVEVLHAAMDQEKTAEWPFGFHYPPASPAMPAVTDKVTKGLPVSAVELDTTRGLMLQRGVALAAARFTGSGKDAEKARQLLASPPTAVPKETVMLASAESLRDLSDLYCPKRLNDANRTKILCKEAREALSAVKPGPETQKIEKKLAEALKQFKTT